MNGAGLVSAPGSSNGIRVDSTPPVVPVVIDDGDYTTSANTLHVVYASGDVESGVAYYEYSVGTAAGLTDVLTWQSAGLVKDETITGLSLANGVMYYINVRAYNRAGLMSEGHSNGILVDLTPPVLTITDALIQTNQVQATVSVSDPESGVAQVQYLLLTSPVLPVSPNWLSATVGQAIVISGVFAPGQTYYVASRAVNGAGTAGAAVFSKALALDSTPPAVPVVTDDGKYQSNAASLHASWVSQDPESGIDHYSYCIGSTSGASDALGWTDTTAASATATGLSLVCGKTYYFGVRATNRVGLTSVPGYSDGITVDTTPPSQPVVVDDGETTSSPDYLHFTLSSTDAESGIAGYSYYIGTSPSDAGVATYVSSSPQGSIVAYGLALVPGVKYYVYAKAVNGAGLWSTVGQSDGIVFTPGASVWPKFRCDARNSGNAAFNAPTAASLYWRFQTTGYVESSPAIGSNGTVYIGSGDGKLYAVSAAGNALWSYPTGACIESSPTIGGDGSVYVGSDDGEHVLHSAQWRS